MAWNIFTVNNSVDAMQFVVLFFDFGRTCLFRACNKQPNVLSSESLNQPS